MRAIRLPKYIRQILNSAVSLEKRTSEIKSRLSVLQRGEPEVSVIIPAYNEEATIVQTLHSLVETTSGRSIEIIVVNNNSRDQTEKIAKAAGAICIHESNQGYSHARNAGLYHARGKYILNADADTLYPPGWIDQMINPMEKNSDVVLVYGQYAFYSTTNRPRLVYFFYEIFSDIFRHFSKKVKDEAAFVMGANSSFLRQPALAENGYEHPPGANEDGYLAIKLRKYGRLYFSPESIVWTSDRRLVAEGNLWKSSRKRIIKYARRFRFAKR